MQVRTFLGKVNVEGLRLMDEQINYWIREQGITVNRVTQVMGTEQFSDAGHVEPVVVTSIWYDSGS
jgi:hypothetical protein